MRLKHLLLLLLIGLLLTGYLLFRPITQNNAPIRFELRSHQTLDQVSQSLTGQGILHDAFWFRTIGKTIGISTIRAGSYLIQPNENLVQLLKRFKNSRQSPLKLVLGNERIRIRTLQQLASKIQRANYTMADSAEWMGFLLSADSLNPLGLNPTTVMTRMLPLSYEIYWTASPREILQSINKTWDRFWNTDRKTKAKTIGLNPAEVSILASIVEEETQHQPDRTLIASTYLNRLKIGMRLQADPTAKFGAGDFDAQQVTYAHLRHESPYNTYLNAGLPPGPICLPSLASIEAVLNAPKTDYLYFVASHRFDGTSVFARDYDEHLRNARLYQDALRKRLTIHNSTR
jgi:UPF0755 protein